MGGIDTKEWVDYQLSGIQKTEDDDVSWNQIRRANLTSFDNGAVYHFSITTKLHSLNCLYLSFSVELTCRISSQLKCFSLCFDKRNISYIRNDFPR